MQLNSGSVQRDYVALCHGWMASRDIAAAVHVFEDFGAFSCVSACFFLPCFAMKKLVNLQDGLTLSGVGRPALSRVKAEMDVLQVVFV